MLGVFHCRPWVSLSVNFDSYVTVSHLGKQNERIIFHCAQVEHSDHCGSSPASYLTGFPEMEHGFLLLLQEDLVACNLVGTQAEVRKPPKSAPRSK